MEAIALLVGEGEMRGPGRREGTALGTEDHELEAVSLRVELVAAVPHGEVAGVVPPLGQSIVWSVVARQDDGDRIRCG